MNVQVKDGLTRIRAIVYRQAKGVAKARISRNRAGRQQQMTQQLGVVDRRITNLR